MNSIEKARSISIWIFLVPFIAVNICLLLVTQFHSLFPNQTDILHNTFPYFDGGASISRTARPYPSWLVFKPAMFLTSYLLIRYWLFNRDIIKYFEVDHKPVKYAYGFNFFHNNKKLTVSGDTRPCENIMKYALFSDVLLHEVFIDGEIKKINKMRTLKTLHNVRDYHTPSNIVGKIAKLSRCKKLVLTHLVPTQFNEKKLKLIVKKDFGKEPIIGKDLLKIKI